MPHVSQRIRGCSPSFLRQILGIAQRPGMISFAGGVPDQALFDIDGLRDAVERTLSGSRLTSFQYGESAGLVQLRDAISVETRRRGIPCAIEDVYVTTGSQQAIDLVAKATLDPGDVVLVERPTYLAALQVFQLYQARIVGVVGDQRGILPEYLLAAIAEERRAGRRVKLLYLVPNYANPTGRLLANDRRQEIAKILSRENLLLLEDDPYGEIRFSGELPRAISAIGREQSGNGAGSIYVSSFSKILSPGLRLGWMVVPDSLKAPINIGKQSVDLQSSTFSQWIVFNYLCSERLPHRLTVIRAAYHEKAIALTKALRDSFPDTLLTFQEPAGGMFIWGSLTEQIDTGELVKYAIARDVVFVPGAYFYSADPDCTTMRLSFATPTSREMHEGADRLMRALEQFVSVRRTEATNISAM